MKFQFLSPWSIHILAKLNLFSINNVLREYNEIKKEIKKFWRFCEIQYIKIVDISRKTYERNGLETIADNNGILWFNEKRVEED